MQKSFLTSVQLSVVLLLLAFTACERDLNLRTASLTINNMTDLRPAPQAPLSIWSVYVTPNGSATPALDRSHDYLHSDELVAGQSRMFTIDSCGQLLDILIRFVDGTEVQYTTATAVDCNTTYIQDVL